MTNMHLCVHPLPSTISNLQPKYPLGEPGRTSLYVGLPSAWGSVDGDLMFYLILYKGSFFWGDSSISLHRDPVGEHGGGSLTRNSEGKMNFQGMGCRRFCRWVSLHRGPVGEPGEGLHLQVTVRDSRRRAMEMEHLSLWEIC